jgi:hypothetical protein
MLQLNDEPMIGLPKDFSGALKESGLDEFFWVTRLRTGENT